MPVTSVVTLVHPLPLPWSGATFRPGSILAGHNCFMVRRSPYGVKRTSPLGCAACFCGMPGSAGGGRSRGGIRSAGREGEGGGFDMIIPWLLCPPRRTLLLDFSLAAHSLLRGRDLSPAGDLGGNQPGRRTAGHSRRQVVHQRGDLIHVRHVLHREI